MNGAERGVKVEKCIFIEKGFIKCMKRTENNFEECKHIHKILEMCYKTQTISHYKPGCSVK